MADQLAEAKDVNPRLLVIDSMAHFYANDFEKAKLLSQRAAKVDPDSAAGQKASRKTATSRLVSEKRTGNSRQGAPRLTISPASSFKTNKGDIVLELFENEAPTPSRISSVSSRREIRRHQVPSRDPQVHGPGRRPEHTR